MTERVDRRCSDNLDVKLKTKEHRLSKSIRTYIRRLKESGKWDEAVRFRDSVVQKRTTRQEVVADELNKTLVEIICADDRVKEAAAEIKVIWLMNAASMIETSEERNNEILKILNSQPKELQAQIEGLMPKIRDEVAPLMPIAG